MHSMDFRKRALAAYRKARDREPEKAGLKPTPESSPHIFRPPPYIYPKGDRMKPRQDVHPCNSSSDHYPVQTGVQGSHHGFEPLPPSSRSPQDEHIRKSPSFELDRYLEVIGASFDFDIVVLVKVPVYALQQDPTRDIFLEPLAIYVAQGNIAFPLQFPVSVYTALTRFELKLHNREQLPSGCTFGLSRGEAVNSTMYIISCFSASSQPPSRSIRSFEYITYIFKNFVLVEGVI